MVNVKNVGIKDFQLTETRKKKIYIVSCVVYMLKKVSHALSNDTRVTAPSTCACKLNELISTKILIML